MFLVEFLHWRISPSGNRASAKKYENEDPNVVEIDLLFLFLFALVLCVVIRTNVVFLVKKPLGPWWDQQKQCGVRFYFVCSAAGRQNFQHW